MFEFLDITAGPLSIRDWLSWIFILTGSFFCIVGCIGIIRFPDVFSRMHGAGVVETVGIGALLVGLMFQADDWIVAVKLVLILLFIFFTSPTTTFALARAAIYAGMNPGPTKKDVLAQSQPPHPTDAPSSARSQAPTKREDSPSNN